jgi:hypothetical protein
MGTFCFYGTADISVIYLKNCIFILLIEYIKSILLKNIYTYNQLLYYYV